MTRAALLLRIANITHVANATILQKNVRKSNINISGVF